MPIELGSLPKVVLRHGRMIMPGEPSNNSPPTAAINRLIAAGTAHEMIYWERVLRASDL